MLQLTTPGFSHLLFELLNLVYLGLGFVVDFSVDPAVPTGPTVTNHAPVLSHNLFL